MCMLGGAAGILYSWICVQKEKQKQLEEICRFLQRTILVMESEKIKIGAYFNKYVSFDTKREGILEKTLGEIAKRLELNIYPNGQSVWEEVYIEEKENWFVDDETFQMILRAGNGFFGASREENICFLRKSLQELEIQQKRMREKDVQERKVWVPVGMLATVMVVILFI